MGVEFSAYTMVDICSDTVASYSGSYSRKSSSVTLYSASSLSFLKSYSYEDSVKTNMLKLKANIDVDDTELSSRYNTNIFINLRLVYWETNTDDVGNEYYVEGPLNEFNIYPYNGSDTDGKIDEYILNLKDWPISRLEIDIINKSESDIVISDFGIFQSLSVQESVGETLTKTITLQGVQEWTTGYIVKFTTGELKMQALKNSSDKFAGYTVNDELVVTWNTFDAPLPED